MSRASTPAPRKHASTIDSLLAKNRSCRGYDRSFRVRADQLRSIVAVNTKIPSAMNRQVLRFRPVLGAEAPEALTRMRLGGALPDLHLPLPGSEPDAYIVVCSTIGEDRYVDIDLGISAQSMLLRAVEIGLRGICVGAFDRKAVREALDLPYEPLLVVALGKGAERIETVEIGEGDDHTYYRRDGVHYVPKVRLDDLIL